MPSRSARALSTIRAAMTKPPSVSRGLRGGVVRRSRASDRTRSMFIVSIAIPPEDQKRCAAPCSTHPVLYEGDAPSAPLLPYGLFRNPQEFAPYPFSFFILLS